MRYAAGPGAGDKIDPQLQAEMATLAPGQMTTAIVTMRDQADLSRIPGADRAARQQGIIRALQAHADASQKQIQGFLKAREAQGLVSQTTSFWVFNGLSVTAAAEVFQDLAARDDVATITPDAIQVTPVALHAAAAPEPNLSVIHAPALWDLGWRGQNVVVANMDSGVDVSHPDLAGRWRGGSNSWFDPYGQHPTTPTDLSGHGTWTMGVMVAGDAGGTALGVAPAAQWIAVKIFNDAGDSTATAIHQGFQWLLDPRRRSEHRGRTRRRQQLMDVQQPRVQPGVPTRPALPPGGGDRSRVRSRQLRVWQLHKRQPRQLSGSVRCRRCQQ